ncbi:MAG: hypothetical protein KBG30_12235 [Bacteroidales bacterium]|nr:hypothetical protein [Bacteroidales bacterium]
MENITKNFQKKKRTSRNNQTAEDRIQAWKEREEKGNIKEISEKQRIARRRNYFFYMLGKRDENNDIIARSARAAYMKGAITKEELQILNREHFLAETFLRDAFKILKKNREENYEKLKAELHDYI